MRNIQRAVSGGEQITGQPQGEGRDSQDSRFSQCWERGALQGEGVSQHCSYNQLGP